MRLLFQWYLLSIKIQVSPKREQTLILERIEARHGKNKNRVVQNKLQAMENKGEIVLYQSPETGFEVQVRLENETVWLSQKLMAQLFEKDTDTIGLHIKNIYSENELLGAATTEYFSVVQQEGGRRLAQWNS